MMFEQNKNILNDDFRGIPEDYIDKPRNYNSIWGREYFIYLRNGLREDSIDALIEDILFFHAIRK